MGGLIRCLPQLRRLQISVAETTAVTYRENMHRGQEQDERCRSLCRVIPGLQAQRIKTYLSKWFKSVQRLLLLRVHHFLFPFAHVCATTILFDLSIAFFFASGTYGSNPVEIITVAFTLFPQHQYWRGCWTFHCLPKF